MQPKERPILSSAPMVRAILAGHKTQTRLVVKPQPPDYVASFRQSATNPREWIDADGTDFGVLCPYGVPGDRLYVRETWGLLESSRVGEFGGDIWEVEDYEGDIPSERINERDYVVFPVYRADGGECGRWRPSIHMPRWASRITMGVVSVRVERLQEITPEDALAEGVTIPRCGCEVCNRSAKICPADASEALMAFRTLWDSINGKREGCSWDANPWVWIVEFRRLEAADAA